MWSLRRKRRFADTAPIPRSSPCCCRRAQVLSGSATTCGSARATAKGGRLRASQARARQRELLRSAWWKWLILIGCWYALVVALHAKFWRFSDVGYGVLLVVPPWVVSVIVMSDPRVAAWTIGADGEEWTGSALRRVLGAEYVIMNDLQLTRRNIDHLVVGPAGLFVVETKWSSEPWGSAKGGDAQRRACLQVQGNVRTLQRELEAEGIGRVPQPLVVLWGGRTRSWPVDRRTRVVDRVTVVAGNGLRQWAADLDTGILTRDERDALTKSLDKIVSMWQREAGS